MGVFGLLAQEFCKHCRRNPNAKLAVLATVLTLALFVETGRNMLPELVAKMPSALTLLGVSATALILVWVICSKLGPMFLLVLFNIGLIVADAASTFNTNKPLFAPLAPESTETTLAQVVLTFLELAASCIFMTTVALYISRYKGRRLSRTEYNTLRENLNGYAVANTALDFYMLASVYVRCGYVPCILKVSIMMAKYTMSLYQVIVVSVFNQLYDECNAENIARTGASHVLRNPLSTARGIFNVVARARNAINYIRDWWNKPSETDTMTIVTNAMNMASDLEKFSTWFYGPTEYYYLLGIAGYFAAYVTYVLMAAKSFPSLFDPVYYPDMCLIVRESVCPVVSYSAKAIFIVATPQLSPPKLTDYVTNKDICLAIVLHCVIFLTFALHQYDALMNIQDVLIEAKTNKKDKEPKEPKTITWNELFHAKFMGISAMMFQTRHEPKLTTLAGLAKHGETARELVDAVKYIYTNREKYKRQAKLAARWAAQQTRWALRFFRDLWRRQRHQSGS